MSRLLPLAAVPMVIWSALALQPASANPAEPVRLRLTTDIVNPEPQRFGMNVDPGGYAAWNQAAALLNNLTADPGFEPTVLRYSGTATGGDETRLINDAGPSTTVWKTIGTGFLDGADVRVYRFTDDAGCELVRTGTVAEYLADESGERAIVFTEPGPPVRKGDLYFVSTSATNPPWDKLHPRMKHLTPASRDTWKPFGHGTVTRDDTTAAPEFGGQSSLKITTDLRRQAGVSQFAFGNPNTVFNAPTAGKTYRVEVWLKQTGIPGGRVSYRNTQEYRGINHTWTDVTDQWQKFSFDFVAPPADPTSPVSEHYLFFEGPGTLWADNLLFYDVSNEPMALRPDLVEQITAFKPGTLRIWSGHTNTKWGTSLDGWLSDDREVPRLWGTDNGPSAGHTVNLPAGLRLCEQTGADPWLVVSPSFSEAEWSGLMEYLAGPADRGYGKLRAEHGRTEPWTNAFDTIYLEMGNETWNSLFRPWTFIGNGKKYGQFSQHMFETARRSPAYPGNGKITFTLGGFFIQANEYGYGAAAVKAAPAADVVGITAYAGGWESKVKLGGDTVNPDGYREALEFPVRSLLPIFEKHAQTHADLAGRGVEYELAIYEGGPGYALPSAEKPFNPIQEAYGKSVAAATMNLDAFCAAAAYGVGPSAFFQLRTGPNWSTHRQADDGTLIPHVSWLAMEMVNNHAITDDAVMLAVVPESLPTVHTKSFNGFEFHGNKIDRRENVPLVSAYGWRDGDQFAVLVLSRRIDMATPVEISLPGTADTAIVHQIEADPSSTNNNGYDVKPTSRQFSVNDDVLAMSIAPGGAYLIVMGIADVPEGESVGIETLDWLDGR
ncbi:MAG: hypothetical protein AAGD32_10395 [Planctomycetota bacterium]